MNKKPLEEPRVDARELGKARETVFIVIALILWIPIVASVGYAILPAIIGREVMLGSYVFGCIVWILWGLVGCSLGNSKGNAQTGLWLSLLAGPLGWIAVLLLPDSREKKNSVNEAAPNADDSREMQIKLLKEILEELRISKAAHLIHIAKGKTDLGNVPIIEVRRALEEGKLGREDYYLDESAQEWKPLGEHPLL